MEFMQALDLAIEVIREQKDELDEIYLYEISSQTQVYLKDCEGCLEFACDESLLGQIYLASFLDKQMRGTSLSLNVIFSASWEVRLRKTEHLKAIRCLKKTGGVVIDYSPADREEVADV